MQNSDDLSQKEGENLVPLGDQFESSATNCEIKNENNHLEDESNEQVEDDFGVEDDEECDEEYGSSGEKYGWYNGFSDDAIDDAFEGDPINTWNVD